MFWKIIRWGGTALVVVLMVGALVAGGSDEQADGTVEAGAPVVEDSAPPVSENKNFNL